MSIKEKGLGQPKYPTGRIPSLKKMPDGNPYPYEQPDMAEDGVFGSEKVDGFNAETDYSPDAMSNEGDSGLGGSGK